MSKLLRFHSGAGRAQCTHGICSARLDGAAQKLWTLEERLDGFKRLELAADCLHWSRQNDHQRAGF